jgi:hypothetical protein
MPTTSECDLRAYLDIECHDTAQKSVVSGLHHVPLGQSNVLLFIHIIFLVKRGIIKRDHLQHSEFIFL